MYSRRKELNTTFTENSNIREKGNCDVCYRELVKYTDLYGTMFIVRKENELASV